MHHDPTQTDYFVDIPDRNAPPDTQISIFEMEARLVGVAEGASVPNLKEQTELGRAAIAVFLIDTGFYWKPEIVHVDRPQDKVGEVPLRD